MIQLVAFDADSGAMIADLSARAHGVEFTTGPHGFASCSAAVAMEAADAFRWYDHGGAIHLEVVANGARAWEGRLEDIAIVDGGLRLTALGYWRALMDAPYTALWSDASYERWEWVTPELMASNRPERFEGDNNNRLFIAPRKNESFSTAAQGAWTYETPDGGSRPIQRVVFSFRLRAPTGWRAELLASARDGGSSFTPWSLNGIGIEQSGAQALTIAPRDRITFRLFYNNAIAATSTAETGDISLRITALRVMTTTSATLDASEVAGALLSHVRGINPSQLAVSAVLETPGTDLTDACYEDAFPAEILDALTPPGWACGVWEDRVLHLWPCGHQAREWYVDATAVEIERTLETLANSAYGVYSDANGVARRTAIATDVAGVARVGLTRRVAVTAQTTSLVAAEVARDASLASRAMPVPRAVLTFSHLYSASGARAPLWEARAGDAITVRNLPPTLSADIDRLRTLRIAETRYHVDDDVLEVVPEFPLPTLDVLVAASQRPMLASAARR